MVYGDEVASTSSMDCLVAIITEASIADRKIDEEFFLMIDGTDEKDAPIINPDRILQVFSDFGYDSRRHFTDDNIPAITATTSATTGSKKTRFNSKPVSLSNIRRVLLTLAIIIRFYGRPIFHQVDDSCLSFFYFFFISLCLIAPLADSSLLYLNRTFFSSTLNCALPYFATTLYA